MDNNVQTHYNGGFAPPPHAPYSNEPMAPVISVKEWMLTFLIMLIPIVNIVMMFVFAFGEGNPSKQNYFKAALLWAAIILGLYLLIFVLFLGALLSV